MKAADDIIATFPRHSNSLYEFVQCDATLMKNVVTASSEVRNNTPTLNYLVLSPGVIDIQGRNETSEGIDAKMALNFYARWKFVDELLPLLQKARANNQEARVMTVLAPGNGGKIDLDDLGLKKTYSFFTNLFQVPTYNDLLVEVRYHSQFLSEKLHSDHELRKSRSTADIFQRYHSLTFIPVWWPLPS